MRKPKNFNRSKKSKFHKVYWEVCRQLDERGIKVYHKEMRDYLGLCYYKQDKIVMNSITSGTKLGLINLLHEYRHLQHFRRELYFAYYHPYYQKPTLSTIHRAEWNCYVFAKSALKKLMGYPVKSKYFDKQWIKKYFFPLYTLENL